RLLQGHFFTNDPASSKLGVGHGQWDRWYPAFVLSFSENPSHSSLAPRRSTWHSAHRGGGCSRQFGVASASNLRLRHRHNAHGTALQSVTAAKRPLSSQSIDEGNVCCQRRRSSLRDGWRRPRLRLPAPFRE